jgi:apolipoprotein D and lipocalin family protein
MVKEILLLLIISVVAVVAVSRNSYAGASEPGVHTAISVDIARYMGVWHEISRLEHRFQKECIGSNAEYHLRSDGEVDVINRCIDATTGKPKEARGRAWSINPVNNSRLKVSFFWPFRGDYWIIELGEKYEYSVVGSPDRKYLWILAREPEMNASVYSGIIERLRSQGFPVDNLVRRPLVKSLILSNVTDKKP